MPLTKIRLSHSAQELFNICERKFQIERFLEGPRERETAPHLSRGHAFGKGVQTYLLTRNMDLALYQAWLAYWPELEDDLKVTQHRTLHALLCAKPHLDRILEDWEVVSFEGKPAIELGVKIIIDDTYYHAGFLDIVMRNKQTGRYGVFDVKYTGSWRNVEVSYGNSGQCIGYSIAVDKAVGKDLAEYDVFYFICQDANKLPKDIQYHLLVLKKTVRDRLNWFITLGIDVDRIRQLRELNVFPLRGQSCLAFNRPCPHFGFCQLTSADKEKDDEEDPHEKNYTFVFHLNDLIEDHLNRL